MQSLHQYRNRIDLIHKIESDARGQSDVWGSKASINITRNDMFKPLHERLIEAKLTGSKNGHYEDKPKKKLGGPRMRKHKPESKNGYGLNIVYDIELIIVIQAITQDRKYIGRVKIQKRCQLI